MGKLQSLTLSMRAMKTNHLELLYYLFSAIACYIIDHKFDAILIA